MTKLHISKGNSKMGSIPSFSLPSGITCSPEACRFCNRNCYYRLHCERFPLVRKYGRQNYYSCLESLPEVEESLNEYFNSPTAPRLFRIHVGGDFFSVEYLSMWIRVATSHPSTRFLAFTKQFGVLKQRADEIPPNLSIILSAWPGMELPDDLRAVFPVAWMQDGTEERVPDNAIECTGNCHKCGGQCWALTGHDVVFKKH